MMTDTFDILRYASLNASALVRSRAFGRDAWEDLRQELILDCVRRLRRFDPVRGTYRGFVSGVMRNRASVLVRHECVRRRQEIGIGAAPYRSESHGELVDCGNASDSDLSRTEMVIDVHRVIAKLPPASRGLARQLMELNVTEISRRSGKSRAGIYRGLKKIRRAFVAAGFEPTTSNRHE
jgi:RNA polymerase sigma factor (sigma-70 family)